MMTNIKNILKRKFIRLRVLHEKKSMGEVVTLRNFVVVILLFGFIACGGGSDSTSVADKSSNGDAVKICSSGAQVTCNSLGGIWASGTATCKSEEISYDVSKCVRAGDANSWIQETVYPAQRDDRWKNAKCNYEGDFLFDLVIPPHPNGIWVIELQAGGFCGFDGNGEGGCSNRTISLVSNKKTTTIDFDADRVTNTHLSGNYDPNDPDFGNASYAFAHYCSSDLWTGTNVEGVDMHYTQDGSTFKKWPFTGHINFDAMMDILHERYGLDDNNPNLQILFRGTSAGGWGVLNNAWDMYKRYPKTAGRGQLMLSSWSGFISSAWQDPNYPVFDIVDATLGPLTELDAFNLLSHTWSSKFYDKCAADHPSDPWICMFGPTAYDYITGPTTTDGNMDLPLLVFQNQQDELYMGLSQIAPVPNGITDPNEAARETWISQMNTAMGLSSSNATTSSKVKWLYSVSDPVMTYDSNSDGIFETSETNVHPPSCYLYRSPNGYDHSLDAMLRNFWSQRGKGTGRGRAAGQIQAYSQNFQTTTTDECANDTYENHP